MPLHPLACIVPTVLYAMGLSSYAAPLQYIWDYVGMRLYILSGIWDIVLLSCGGKRKLPLVLVT